MKNFKLEGKVEQHETEINEVEFMNSLMEEMNSKTLNIIGTFNEDMVKYVQNFANNLWYSEEDIQRPLFINISSHGGFSSSLMAILDILEGLKETWDCSIITQCNGYSESCGGILWLYGDERQMGKYSEIMIHEPSYRYEGRASEHKQEVKITDKLIKKINKIITEKTPLTDKQLRTWYKKGDKIIDRDEALKLGLINEDTEQ